MLAAQKTAGTAFRSGVARLTPPASLTGALRTLTQDQASPPAKPEPADRRVRRGDAHVGAQAGERLHRAERDRLRGRRAAVNRLHPGTDQPNL
jgi:hypothetical protein